MVRLDVMRRDQIGEAIFGSGGVSETDLPRDQFAPSLDAVADLGHRIAQIFGTSWSRRIRRTIELAARVRAASPRGAFPPSPDATRAELAVELRRMRPELMAAVTFARLMEADTALLAKMVDAYRVIDAYRRRT